MAFLAIFLLTFHLKVKALKHTTLPITVQLKESPKNGVLDIKKDKIVLLPI